jgi:hypothetical protein
MRAEDGGGEGKAIAAVQDRIAVASEDIRPARKRKLPVQLPLSAWVELAGWRQKGKGCGNDGPVESVEKRRQLSHAYHRPLEISQTARDSHIPTAQLRPGWESGKPEAGFPLSHTGLATTIIVEFSKPKTEERNRPLCGLLTLIFQDHSVLETEPDFRIILGLENAEE